MVQFRTLMTKTNVEELWTILILDETTIAADVQHMVTHLSGIEFPCPFPVVLNGTYWIVVLVQENDIVTIDIIGSSLWFEKD